MIKVSGTTTGWSINPCKQKIGYNLVDILEFIQNRRDDNILAEKNSIFLDLDYQKTMELGLQGLAMNHSSNKLWQQVFL